MAQSVAQSVATGGSAAPRCAAPRPLGPPQLPRPMRMRVSTPAHGTCSSGAWHAVADDDLADRAQHWHAARRGVSADVNPSGSAAPMAWIAAEPAVAAAVGCVGTSGRWHAVLTPPPSTRTACQDRLPHWRSSQRQDASPAVAAAAAVAGPVPTCALACGNGDGPGHVPPSPPHMRVAELSTPPTPPPPHNERDRDRLEYFANVGDAIRTLRDDIPHVFERDLNYDIYRNDILFKDERDGKSIRGLEKYRTLFWSLRFHAGLLCSAATVDVLRIWQPEDGVIRMRWSVRSQLRVPLPFAGGIAGAGDGGRVVVDGVSTYRLDDTGRVREHSVTDVILRDPPLALSPLKLLGQPVPAGSALGSGSW
uniref:Uncharacterized protein n=1 Tax=Chlamydomonas euryale TaxID=1486919 RepID=A0A7R9VZ88_9CHLO|mmetsp:Transcript_773/g.2084  ORF Transcript_773/g.2084 Transcript_773/m.2084 type:complete len:365 (+) Transcript_773:474-1568(+)